VSPQSDPATDPGRVLAAVMVPAPIGCLEAERTFLGALLGLQARSVIAPYLAQVEAQDFTDPRNAATLAVIRTVVEQPPHLADPVLVVGELRRTGLEKCFTADRAAAVYLADLLEAPGSLGSIGAYLRILIEHRVRREVETYGVRLQQLAGTSDLAGLLEHLAQAHAATVRACARLAGDGESAIVQAAA
jgi:replicative DNA helicase